MNYWLMVLAPVYGSSAEGIGKSRRALICICIYASRFRLRYGVIVPLARSRGLSLSLSLSLRLLEIAWHDGFPCPS